MAPPKSGRVQECHLIQVAFEGGVHFWEVPFPPRLSPGWTDEAAEDSFDADSSDDHLEAAFGF